MNTLLRAKARRVDAAWRRRLRAAWLTVRVCLVCCGAGVLGTKAYVGDGSATVFKGYMGYLTLNCLFCAGYTLRAIMVRTAQSPAPETQ